MLAVEAEATRLKVSSACGLKLLVYTSSLKLNKSEASDLFIKHIFIVSAGVLVRYSSPFFLVIIFTVSNVHEDLRSNPLKGDVTKTKTN